MLNVSHRHKKVNWCTLSDIEMLSCVAKNEGFVHLEQCVYLTHAAHKGNSGNRCTQSLKFPQAKCGL